MTYLRKEFLISACATAFFFSACGNRNETELLNDAKNRLAKGEQSAAIIEPLGSSPSSWHHPILRSQDSRRTPYSARSPEPCLDRWSSHSSEARGRLHLPWELR